jgi:predicted O-methyltransferase YrrM
MKTNTSIPGWMFEKELNILSKLAGFVPNNGAILEVGCFLGSSTTALYKGKHSSVSMDVIDNFNMLHSEKFFDISIEKMRFVSGSNDLFNAAKEIAKNSNWQEAFKFCIGDEMYNDLNVYPLLSKDFKHTKKYDLTFIDASHKFEDVLHDVEKFRSDTGLLVGDDFFSGFPGVADALNLSRQSKTLIVFEKTKLWVLVPKQGYWRELFKNNNLLFL